MNILQAIIIGLMQGFTELFPISSLGHSVIIPKLLGWDINQSSPYFLTFLVATHLATALVLLAFFYKDWIAILKGLGRSLAAREIGSHDVPAKLGWLLVVATVPAGILGLLFQDPLRSLFASAQIAAGFLIINGFILLIAEHLRKRSNVLESAVQSDQQIAKLRWTQVIGIGTAQAAALFPGISRSGSSMAGGLIAGLDNEAAARFSFLLATPIIGAAALLKLPELFQPAAAPFLSAIVVGSLFAGVSAFLSVRFLIKYFQTKTMKPFAFYCLGAGVLYSLILLVR